MLRCPHCAAVLETPLGCTSCGRLLESDRELTPFELFGWSPSDDIDPRDLHKRFLRFSRLIHPDFFAGGSVEQKTLAERNSALLNEARETLNDDVRRADWLVQSLDGPDENAERQMPRAFLLEVLEWNEVLEEARHAEAGSPVLARLDELEQELRANRAETLDGIHAKLTPLPARGATELRDVRRELNAVRYVDRALDEIEARRLARPALP